ncbi:MAG: oligosaccharide flippase family protein [Clostridia bacterium]|nr:oligosaccharide flippase family protein [Clostridia bacterium]
MEYSENKKTLLNGVLWLGMSAIILKIIGMVYKIPLSYILGDEGMGYFNSAYTIYTLFYIVGSAGLPKAVSILCAKSDDGEGKRIFTYAFSFFSLFGFLLFIILLVFSRFASNLISSSGAVFSIIAISPSVFFVCSSGVIRGYLNGKTRFFSIAISELIGGVCKLVLGLVFAQFSAARGFALPVVSAFSILGITVGGFLGFLYLLTYYLINTRKIKETPINKRSVRSEILKIALPITLASFVGSLVNVIDLSVIMNALRSCGYADSVSTVIYGNYTTLAVPMFTAISSFISPIALSSLPIMSKAYHTGDEKGFFASVLSAVNMASFIAVPSFLLFLLFPDVVLRLLFEEGSVRIGASFLSALSPAILFCAILTVFNTALESRGKASLAMVSLIVGSTIKLVFSSLLISNENIGALAAPLGTCASYLVSLLISYVALKGKNRIFSPLVTSNLHATAASVISLSISVAVTFGACNVETERLKSLIFMAFFGFSYLMIVGILFYKRKKMVNFLSKYTKNKVSDY